jgi:hypothetical protein
MDTLLLLLPGLLKLGGTMGGVLAVAAGQLLLGKGQLWLLLLLPLLLLVVLGRGVV